MLFIVCAPPQAFLADINRTMTTKSSSQENIKHTQKIVRTRQTTIQYSIGTNTLAEESGGIYCAHRIYSSTPNGTIAHIRRAPEEIDAEGKEIENNQYRIKACDVRAPGTGHNKNNNRFFFPTLI